MSTSILLPLDGSGFSEHALTAALDLTRRLQGRLHLVHVHEPLASLPAQATMVVEAELGRSLREQEEQYLNRVATRCQELAGITPRTSLLEGPVATALAGYIHDAAIDLVVMTTHGRGGISRAWVGSVADALVRRSTVPVLLLRPQPGAAAGGFVHGLPAAALPADSPQRDAPPLACRHLLVTLDGSPLAEGILEPIRLFTRLFRPRVSLLRVVAPLQLVTEPVGTAAVLSQDPRAIEHAVGVAHAYLEEMAARLRAEGLEVETEVQVHSVAAVAILDHAAAHAVDAIAMATHGRGGWSRVALGSVADKVMRGTLMPVILYRPPAALAEAERNGARVPHAAEQKP